MKKSLCVFVLLFALGAEADNSLEAWHNSDKWDQAGDAMLNPHNVRRLVGKPGTGVLVNGKDFTGWRVHPKVKKMWSIENGVLKSHGLLEEWGADLVTEKTYRDYVLMADFRMPARSDSGIHFRNLAPAAVGQFGDAEQFNIVPGNGMGQLESFHFLPTEVKQRLGLTPDDLPQIKSVHPRIGVWHTVKLTVIGKNVTAELDGEVILDRFEYPEGILSTSPNPIRFQKHRFTEGNEPGNRNPCPIEFRNIFIKELGPADDFQSGKDFQVTVDCQDLPTRGGRSHCMAG